MAFPTTSVLDSFNRADGALGANWSAGVFGESGLVVAGNAAAGSGSFNTSWWNVATFGPDAEVYLTLGTPTSGNTFLKYMGLRTQTPGSGAADCYELTLVATATPDTLNCYRVDNGSQTLLGSAINQDVAVGDSLGLEAVGSTLTIYYKASAGSWTSMGTRTDSTYGTGYVFMGIEGTTPRWDDFGGGTVVSGAASLAAAVMAATASSATATLRGGAALSAAALTATASSPTATLTAGGRLAADVMAATASSPTASMSAGTGNAHLDANVMAATASLATATLSASSALQGAALAATASAATAILRGGATLAAGAMHAVASLRAASFGGFHPDIRGQLTGTPGSSRRTAALGSSRLRATVP